MKNVIRVTTNTAWQIASKAINSISGLIIIALIQRTYGAEGVGLYTLIIGYVGFYFVPVDFGLNAVAVKHLLQKERDSTKVFKNLLGLRLVIGLGVTLIALLIAVFLPYDQNTATGYTQEVKLGILLVSATIIAQAVLATTNAYFQAKLEYKYSFVANCVSAILNTLLIIFLVVHHNYILVVISAYTVSGLVGAAVALYQIKKQTKTIRPLFVKPYWKELLKDTLPLTISLVLNLIYFRIDSLILPVYRSLTEVGHYNVAYKVFDAILVTPNYFANALYPILLEKWNENLKSFLATIKKSALLLTGIAIVGTGATYLLAPYIIKILLNVNTPEPVTYLRILASGLVLFFLSSISMWSLIVIGKQKLLSYIYGTTMILNIILNLTLIPVYGALASAYITLFTEGIVLLISGTMVLKSISTLRAKNK
jgi:O-antigen/teichoic acid export membrane protein